VKIIPNFPTYRITKGGRVWSTKGNYENGQWMKLQTSCSGYLYVKLRKCSKYYHCLIHRLVLETYVGPCPEGMQCRHLNGNPQDNHLENLCWGTPKENHADAIRHKTHQGLKNHGEMSNFSKLTEQKVKLIHNLYHSGADSQQGLADAFGISQHCVQTIVTKKTWGYLWD